MSKTRRKAYDSQRNYGYEHESDSKHLRKAKQTQESFKNWKQLDRALKSKQWDQLVSYDE